MKRIFLLFLVVFAYSCTKNKLSTPESLQVNNFIYKGLNNYYLWQDNVPNLADTRFLNNKEYNAYLENEGNSAQFFTSLIYEKGIIDKWSWIVDDYVALEQSFQGTTKTTGMEFGLVRYKDNPTNLFGYVRYVVPGTDAEAKNVLRGMLFNKVNGNQLTEKNYRSLLFSEAGFTINLSDYNNGNPIVNGNSISLNKDINQENPVFITKTFTEGNKKIGYLMYNSFVPSFDGELNAAFATLKAENITDLIVDVRYNGGGSVRTTTYLASMITGQYTNQLFSSQKWNTKIMEAISNNSSGIDLTNKFPNEINNGKIKEAINSLNLTRVFFITTNSSASASELIINGLIPYIDVKSVGTKTHGKYVGSVTLYDSENFTKNKVNQNHTWAMQPIVLEIVNKLGENDKDGFDPTVEFAEDYENLGVLGEKSDPLLNRTIQFIVTGNRSFSRLKNYQLKEISNSKLELPTSNNMYVDFN
ncbi:MAG: S41 family peptidase [Flavobacteriaceae bacterium]